MAITAIRIAGLVYDAARLSFDAAVEFFNPGMPVPLRIAVRVPAAQNIEHQALVRGLVHAAERQVMR